MRKYTILLPFFLCLFFISCQKESFQIRGTGVASFEGKQVTLITYDNEWKEIKRDSTFLKDSRFYFKGEPQPGNFSHLSVFDDSLGYEKEIPVILEAGVIKVDLDGMGRRSGTYLNEEYQKYRNVVDYYYPILRHSFRTIDNFENSKEHLLLQDSLYSQLSDIIINNSNNFIGKTIITVEINPFPIFHFNSLKSRLEERGSNEEISTAFIKYERAKQEEITRHTMVGKSFPEYLFEDTDGKMKSLKEIIQPVELIYIDFWASWCGPCIHEIKKMNQFLYNYESAPVQFINISVDDNKEAWLQAIEKQNITWSNLRSPNGFSQELKELYALSELPYGLLIDKNGKILEVFYSIDKLEKRIQNKL